MDNRPQGRQKNITGHGSGVQRRGSGLGTGPVGSGGRPGQGSGRGSGGPQRSGGGGGLFKLLLLLLAVLFGGGAGIGGLLGGETEQAPSTGFSQVSTAPTQADSVKPYDPFGLFGFGGYTQSGSGYTQSGSGWLQTPNTGKLNTAVDPGARDKRTVLLGGGRDTVTVMVYMCGTDLESQSAMGTKDLQEMLSATISDQVNLIVYTGGCRQWRNNVISSSANQIYQVKNGGLVCLKKNAGSGAMTSPNTLASFIDFCSENFPANRNMLILWDHGGGSISGYGYDEKNKSAGAMSLSGLDTALKSAGVQFDMIGFDACLMATLETGLTMANYADYLVASEETEPGLGWYYTNWLTALSRNTSMPTVELGKKIADDFVSVSVQSCPGQKTTLSVVDLAELQNTVPSDFHAFSSSVLSALKKDGYTAIANARGGTREFAASTKIDQIDLVHLALKLGTEEGRNLAQTLLSAVKYNKTSQDMTNAYGLSIYFPYRKLSGVSGAVAAYKAIGLDSAYSDCIRAFAGMESAGQTAAGSSTTPMTALNGQSYGGAAMSDELLLGMLDQLFGGGVFGRSLEPEAAARYLADNRFNPDALVWADGVLHLSEDQWSLVQELELNVFVDDGSGYIDLGLDNTFEFTEDGDLVGSFDGTWLAIDGQNVAYYHTDTTTDSDGYTITGRVPVLLNGQRAELILVFTDAQPFGYIAGARRDYRDGETETVAKGITELTPGDTIDFLCDYYSYSGDYQDSYMLGQQHIYTGSEVISNVYLDAPASACYRFTDIYQMSYWTPVIGG